MNAFGSTLRAAREAKNYTVAQIAETTHIMAQVIEGLECEDFSRIVAPIYGRGFVKLYCEFVGLDPKPLVEAFMEIYEDRKNNPRKPGDLPPESEAEPEAEEAVSEYREGRPPCRPGTRQSASLPTEGFEIPSEVAAPEPEVAAPEPETAAPPAEPAFTLEAETVPPPVEDPLVGIRPAAGDDAPAPIKRDFRPAYADNLDSFRPKFTLPPAVGRIALLAVAALVVLVLAFFGIRALYRLTMTAPAEPAAEKEVAEEEVATPAPAEPAAVKQPESRKTAEPDAPAAKAPRTPRKPVDIPPLYMD